MSRQPADEIARSKEISSKAKLDRADPANSMESVISGLQQLRNESIAIGLPKVTACIDYAYYEALGALRESRLKS
jgi:hypothetical protein